MVHGQAVPVELLEAMYLAGEILDIKDYALQTLQRSRKLRIVESGEELKELTGELQQKFNKA